MATRDLQRELKAAPWRDQREADEFVRLELADGVPESAELARLLPLLGERGAGDAAQRQLRLRVFSRLCAASTDPDLATPLVRALKGADATLRAALTPLLAQLATNPVTHPELCQYVKSTDPALRRAAAQILRKVGGKTALRLLSELLVQDGWPSRVEAIELLADMAGHHAIDTLGRVMAVGAPAEKVAALKVLGDLHYVEKNKSAAAAVIRPMLDDRGAATLLQAVTAYAAVAPEAEFVRAVGDFLDAEDPRLVATVIQALATYRSANAVEVLARFSRPGRPLSVRIAALSALQTVATDDVLSPLSAAVSDPTLAVRSRAVEVLIALTQGGQLDVSRMLLWLLRSRDVNTRRTALEIVRHVGQNLEELWPRLLRLLRDEDWWVRERVVDVLVEMAGRELTRHVVGYLQDPSDVVRRYAVEVLIRIKDPRALGALVKTAQTDTDWWVRERAVEGCGELRDVRAVPYVVAMMKQSPELAFVAVDALAKIGGPEALAGMVQALENPDAEVRVRAIEQLEASGERSLAQLFVAMRSDPEPRVREQASRVLAAWSIAPDGDSSGMDAAMARLSMLDRLLVGMVRNGADDLILTAGRRPYVKRMGVVMPVAERDVDGATLAAVLDQILKPAQRESYLAGEDVDLSYAIRDEKLRFRVNVFRQLGGPAAVFRTIPQRIQKISDLGWPKLVPELCRQRNGLVLVGGPTGSGKSTTLAAMIDLVNENEARHILTIEDPIEVVHAHKRALVTQREVETTTRTFASALRAAMREDPDVILVGEMRDLETVAFAVTAAETGHLVLATLHTVSADASIDRIINTFPSQQQPQVRSMLAESLRAVLCQQLLRRRDGRGRVLAMEVLLNNDAVSNIIRKGKCYQLPSLIATSRELGMQTLDQDLKRLLTEGAIEPEEAYLKATDKKDFESFLAATGAARAAEAALLVSGGTPPLPGGRRG